MGGSQPAKDLSPWELDPDAPQNARSGIHDVVNSRSGIQAMTSQISRTALMTGWSSDTGRKTALRRYHVGSVEGATVRVPDRFTEHAPLHGRAVERSVVDGLLAGARAGRSGVLVVRGDPGIGKTALLDALCGAFGLRRAESGDRFLVGLAVLSLLAELAGDGPLLCLADDAHWLDRSSAEALVFAARRLDAEGIAVIFAARDHDAPFPAPGLPVLRLGGLDAAAAAALLMVHGGAGLPPGARCRVLAEARGNPLGRIELCAAYRDHARAAVYQAAVLGRRLAVHRALAGVLRNPADADRRAWHLAAAATGPDEEVAAELERTAAKASARSGYAAAAAAYERAVQLTADPAAQAGRLTLAAAAAAEIGEFDRARSLAARAAAQATDPVVQARLANVRALADFAQGRLATAHRLLVDGAARITDLDPPQAVRMLMNAMHIAWFLGDRALMADTADRLRLVGGSVADPLAPLVQLMLRSTAQAAGRPADDHAQLSELVATARRCRAGHRDDLAMIAMVSLVTGLNRDARDLAAELVADARSHGRIGWLPAMLNCLAQALAFDGLHRDALATATEALRIAQDTGQAQWVSEANAITAYLAAVDGDEDRCRQLVHAALAGPADHSTSAARPWADWALGLLDLGLGRLDTALLQLEAIAGGPVRYHGSALRSIPDLVEAAVRLGEPGRVAGPLDRFRAWTRQAGQRGTEALAERCQALLGADQDAEQHYLAALKLHDESFEQARTQLLYGAWLRRARRKAQARTQLRAAADYLDRTGAAPWADRARAELSATGVTTPRPSRTGLPRLTPQELQVARLAAQGLSNRDIAAQLFLSPRTVGYHLYKAYPKLGVTSRSQLDPQALQT